MVTAVHDTLLLAPDQVVSFNQVLESVYPSLVLVHNGREGVGAGILWSHDGLVLTNNHVVGRSRQMAIHLADGPEQVGQVFARRPEADLALLRLPEGEYPAAAIGDSRSLRVGEIVLAVGHPWGQPGYVTLGIVSALGTAYDRQGKPSLPIIRSDAPLAPGNSGGPLVNAAGEVVGINTMIVGGDQGVAVPIHVAAEFIQEALAAPLPSRNGRGRVI